MQKYETVFIVNPTLSEEERNGVFDKIKAIIETKGKLGEIEDWGIKKLAYKINNKFTDGYYYLIKFEAENDCLDELNHVFKITEDIIRDIIVKAY